MPGRPRQSTASGGGGTDATITFTDITTNDVTSTKHGFAPKSPGDATKFLNGGATPGYTTPTGTVIQHVETQTLLADATDVTFSGLNGDTDGRYVLFCNLKGAGVGTANIYLRPNGGTSNLVDTYTYAGSGFDPGTVDGTNGIIGFILSSGQIGIRVDIWPKTGLFRKWFSHGASDQPSHIWCSSNWTDDSTNITSLVVHSTVAAQFKAASVFTLYKMPNG